MAILRRAAVIGSRSFKDYDQLKSYLDKHVICHIVSGGASGADRLVERYARERKILFTCIFPDYIRYGRGAPLRRNKDIIEQVDHCIAFWDGESRGTEYTIRLAEKAGIPVRVVAFQYLGAKGFEGRQRIISLGFLVFNRHKGGLKVLPACIDFVKNFAMYMWDGESMGTKHALGLAKRKGIPIHICDL